MRPFEFPAEVAPASLIGFSSNSVTHLRSFFIALFIAEPAGKPDHAGRGGKPQQQCSDTPKVAIFSTTTGLLKCQRHCSRSRKRSLASSQSTKVVLRGIFLVSMTR